MATTRGRWFLGDAPSDAAPKGGTRLPAGGWLSPFRTGHYEVTRDAAEAFGFTSAAISILADASQDPDFYEWGTPAAHAQTPDAIGFLAEGGARTAGIEAAQGAFYDWMTRQAARVVRLAPKRPRDAIYFLGYMLHGVEDLAPHAGRTNAEHAANHPNPDHDVAAVELARAYALSTLRHVRQLLGTKGFDALRRWTPDGLLDSWLSKREKAKLHGNGWDFSVAQYQRYEALAKTWKAHHVGVRWPRERVLGRALDLVCHLPADRAGTGRAKKRGSAEVERIRFEPLAPEPSPKTEAEWTVLVYLAGDDANPNGIEYAVRQDLGEMKRLGSNRKVHFIAQTDEVRERYGHRYRLRKGTSLHADRVGVFKGDLNTGRTRTLVDFVRWAREWYPAKRYALVLWGHGSGHDDQDVYRLARGTVSPRLAARLAQKRLGFFGGTRRALLERNGPARGYGYDDTSGDFLDDVELADALAGVRGELGQPVDLLGFDACLMSMVEVAYQVHEHARVMVASQLTEPGDGWSYGTAFGILKREPATSPQALGKALVDDFEKAYENEMTLAAVDLGRIPALADGLESLAGAIDAPTFDRARTKAIDCSPQPGGGYRDLESFLEAAGPAGTTALRALRKARLRACGNRGGLCAYLPSDYRPDEVGGTDALYERLDLPAKKGWADMLRRIYADRAALRPSVARKAAPEHGLIAALDRHNAEEVLGESFGRGRVHWAAKLRAEILAPMKNLALSVIRGLRDGDGSPPIRIFCLPGIMGSTLSDRAGHHGLCWVDPIGLAIGSDFDALTMTVTPGPRPEIEDLDPAVRIEASGVIPVVYDRMALALMAAFGPVVEQVPYDWRRPIAANGAIVAGRMRAWLEGGANRRAAVVAHSMGGMVAAHALRDLGRAAGRVVGLVALGTPWNGSFEAVANLRGDGENLKTFDKMTRLGVRELLGIVHSFWGLTDLLPAREDLLDARLYTAGPLGREPAGLAQLASPRGMRRDPFERTFAVVSDKTQTVADLEPGSLRRLMGPGDGTVPIASATFGGRLPHAIVDQGHSTIPLDGEAIDLTIEKLEGWLGAASRKTHVRVGKLPVPDTRRPRTRARLFRDIERAEAGGALTLGTLVGLLALG